MRTLLVATLLLIAPALAAADDAPAPAPSSRTTDVAKMKNDDCARARKANKTCVLDMGGESLEATAPTAGGGAVGVITFGKATSLIRIRRDFITEILKSAEDLD
jgi:hypothetical protein